MESIPCWQKIWKSFTSKLDIHEKVIDILPYVEKELPSGISEYDTFTMASFNEWKKICGSKSETHSSLARLIRQLSISLNLNSCKTWGVFCNFLLFNYYGKFEEMANLAKYELHVKDMIREVFKFYTYERIFKLKTLKYILEHYQDDEHKYKKEMEHFVKTVTLKKLRSNLMNQFKMLLNEITLDNAQDSYNVQDWIYRNNREQLEVLLCISKTIKDETLEMSEYIELLKLFKEHDFTRQPMYYEGRANANASDYEDIKNIEFGIFFIGMKCFWTDGKKWAENSAVIKKLLVKGYEESYRHENILFSMYYSALNLYHLDTHKERYYDIFKDTLSRNALNICLQVARSDILKTSAIRPLVREAIFTFLEYILKLFLEDNDVVIYDSKPSIELLADLFHDENLAVRSLIDEETSVKSFYLMATDMFPFDFTSITLFAKALIQHEQFSETVVWSLMHIPHYVDLLDEETLMEYRYGCDYFPNAFEDFFIPANQKYEVFNKFRKSFMKFDHEYSYFKILELDMARALHKKYYEHEEPLGFEIVRIEKGYSLLLEVLRYGFTKKEIINNVNIKNCLQLMEYAFEVFQDCNYFELIEVFFDIVKEIIFFDIKIQPTIINMFPKLLIQNIRIAMEYQRKYLSPAVITKYLQNEEALSNHSLLIKYVNLVKELFIRKQFLAEIVVPGVLYIILFVFPEHFCWSYEDGNDKYRLTKDCLTLIFLILEKNLTDATDRRERDIFNFCLESILTKKQVLYAFLATFELTDDIVQKHMIGESDWENGRGTALLRLKKLTFTLLLLLFKYNEIEKENKRDNFFNQFLTRVTNESLKVLRSIVAFVNNNFWISLANLACALLKTFAKNEEFTFLPCLNLDYCQVQSIFLEKLHDPLVPNSLKVSILELISVCIHYQDGMTAAFFNINCDSIKVKNELTESCESVKAIMLNYLENQKENLDYLHHPVQLQILKIFYNLWKYEKELIITDIIKTDNFWTTMLKPLTQELTLGHEAYGFLFGIVTLELYRTKDCTIDESLVENLKTLFSPKEKCYITWSDYFHELCLKFDNTKELDNFNRLVQKYDVNLMNSWKNFLIMIVTNAPQCCEDTTVRKYLIKRCLDCLAHHVFVFNDIRVMCTFFDIYLFLISKWHYSSDVEALNKIVNVLNCFINCYRAFNSKARNTLLAIISETIKQSELVLKENPNYLDGFLIPLGKICECSFNSLSLDKIDDAPDEKYRIDPDLKQWVLVLTIGNNLLELGSVVQHSLWFSTFNFLQKVITTTLLFLKKPKTLLIAKISIETLIMYTKSHLCHDFLKVNLSEFYEGTRPDKLYLDYGVLKREYRVPRYLKEFWATYSEIIRLNITLTEKFGHLISPSCLSFIYVHDEIMRTMLLSVNYTVDLNSLEMVCVCLKFIETMLQYRLQWIGANALSFERIICAIIETLNASIRIILRPDILFFVNKNKESLIDKQGNVNEKVPASSYVNVMNKIMEIIAMCFRCFSACLPPIEEFLESENPKKYQYFLILHDYQLPKFTAVGLPPHVFSYGSLLCLLYFLSKTSMQINVINKLDQNPTRETAGDDMMKSLTTLIGLKNETYDAIVVEESLERCFPEKMNTVLKFAMSEVQGTSQNWLTSLDVKKVRFALEMLLRFLCVQAYLVVHSDDGDKNQVENFKKEMSSELHFFNEFAKRSIYEKYQGKKGSLPMKRKLEFVHFIEQIKNDNYDGDFHEEFLLYASYWLADYCEFNL